MTASKPGSARTLRALIALGLVVVGVLLTLLVLLKKKAPEKAPPIQARLELAAGPVDVDLGHGPEHAVSGAALLADSKISTDKGARALVRLPDGSAIFLRDSTKVALAATSVALEAGEYWVDAPPTDREAMLHRIADVEVSAVDAGLSIRRDADGVIAYVARGMATLQSKGGRVEVHAGEQVVAKGGDAPKVAAVSFWDDWTGGMADRVGKGLPGAGAGTIYGVDEGGAPGSAARKLEIQRQVVHAVVREGLSETEVDQTFFNPSERAVEGWYWFTVPERASVTGFAVETNGALVEGEFIEKKEAAARYGEAKQSGFSPAILEWVDAHTYRARIFPISAGGTRRVVLRYVELSPAVDGKLSYLYPFGAGASARIGEFSLSVDLGDDGPKMKIATLADARIEQGGRSVTMRRSGYTPRADFQLEAMLGADRPPLTISRFAAGGDSADYVLARYRPDVDWASVKQLRGDVVVVVDTSAAGDESSRQLKAQTAEAILRALSDEDRFALVSLDVKPTVLHPKDGLAPASDAEIQKALEALADHSSGGATDLASMFDVALGRLHGTDQPAVVYVGDGIATSGEMGGEALVERLRRALSTSRARLFTVSVGVDADDTLLGELARAGGGSHFAVEEADATTARALELAAALKVPTITDLQFDLGAGLDDSFVSASGKVSRGQEVTVLARTHHDIPPKIHVKGRLGGQDFDKQYDAANDKSVLGAFVPRLWAAEYVRRLLGGASSPDADRGHIVSLGLEYGLMTPYTSVLALDSEAAYSSMGIQRHRSKLRGVRLSALDAASERRLVDSFGPTTPMIAFACSKSDRAVGEAAPSTVSEVSSDDREGATGTRSKAEAVTAAPPMGGSKDDGVQRYASRAPAEQAAPTPTVSPTGAAPGTPLRGALDEDKKGGVDQPASRPPPDALGPSGSGSGLGGGGDLKLGGGGGVAARPRALGGLGGQGAPAKTTTSSERRDNLEKAKLAPPPSVAGWSGPIARPVSLPSLELATCSDSAERPLAQRVLLWQKRLKTAQSPYDLVERYESARRACELPDWRAERTFLELMQKRVDDPGAASVVLGHFAARPDVRVFIGKLILRRSVSQPLIAAVETVLFGGAVNWTDADNQLAEIGDLDKRIAKLREFIARAPEDPNGGMRLVRLLVDANKKEEALALGRRLRDSGLLTPLIARQIGDVLARAGENDEAVRTYSEIVEFDPDSIASRKLLGDIYLGHGWYEPAYRQYLTITLAAKTDALGWLRLAAAAAGSGRVDEALRLERQVAGAQGTPGPSDPRRWARLLSATRLARLIDKPPADAPGQPPVDPKRRAASMERELKELQLFSGPGTLVVLTWESLDAELTLVPRVDKKDAPMGELTDAAPAGLYSVALPTPDAASATFLARLRSPRRDEPVRLIRHDIVWDGKSFHVTVKPAELAVREVEAAL